MASERATSLDITVKNDSENSDTKHRLLVAAVRAFAEKGFDGAGIREIAQNAQANSALVQYYFGGKEGLYRATLSFLFDHGHQRVLTLAPPPGANSPGAVATAIECLKCYVQAFLEDLLIPPDGRNSQEFRSAAHLFWTRELLQPDHARAQLVLDHIRPYATYLSACLRALRTDLDDEQRFLMACSIQGQILFFHQDSGLIARLRGTGFGPEDIHTLTHHITAFSLRGLGIHPAF